MYTFTSLVDNILNETKSILFEMPVATQGRDVWVRGVLNRFGTYGEKGWVQSQARPAQGVNQRDNFHTSLFVVDKLADLLRATLAKALTQLFKQGIIRTKKDILTNLSTIMQVSGLDKCALRSNIEDVIQSSYESMPGDVPVPVSSLWFKELILVALATKIFDYIFKPNVDNIAVSDFYKRPFKQQGVLPFFNSALTELDFINEIKTALVEGFGSDKPPLLLVIAKDLGIDYTPTKIDIENMSRLFAQCRAEIVSDFESNHPTQYKL